MLVVAALGGNALVQRGGPVDIAHQQERVRTAAQALAEIARRHDLVVTHGNGPQVGLLALEAEAAGDVVPLDVLGAESEGMIGYWIEQELERRLPGRDLATLLTRVEVDGGDPAFASPSKPIGPLYDEATARRLAEQRGFRVAACGGHFRRVVPSPEPRRILELRTIRLLVRVGVLVVCGGGGGIPVVADASGGHRGVEAVIDKDLSSALLAAGLGADALLLLTDVPGVYVDWPDRGRLLRALPPRHVRDFALEPGTMAPKLEAARRFAVTTGGTAAIGALEEASALLRGEAGTTVAARIPGPLIETAEPEEKS